MTFRMDFGSHPDLGRALFKAEKWAAKANAIAGRMGRSPFTCVILLHLRVVNCYNTRHFTCPKLS